MFLPALSSNSMSPREKKGIKNSLNKCLQAQSSDNLPPQERRKDARIPTLYFSVPQYSLLTSSFPKKKRMKEDFHAQVCHAQVCEFWSALLPEDRSTTFSVGCLPSDWSHSINPLPKVTCAFKQPACSNWQSSRLLQISSLQLSFWWTLANFDHLWAMYRSQPKVKILFKLCKLLRLTEDAFVSPAYRAYPWLQTRQIDDEYSGP